MRIVYISNTTIPSRLANSVHIMKMCQAFAKNGHEVILLAPRWSREERTELDPFDFYGVDKCFNIEKLPRWGGSLFYGISSALRAKKLKPDIVYCRFVPGCFFSSLLGLTSIWESHAPIREFSAIGKWAFAQFVLKRSERIVLISNALKQYYIEEYKTPEQQTCVAPDAADETGETETILFEGPEKLHAGYIGGLYPGKGVEIIELLAKKCPWACFHLIGGADSDIKYWKERLGNANNIQLYGFLPHSETDKYRRSFDVLLAPYQRKVSVSGGGDVAQWMSPLKIFEYMSACKPMLVSDLPVLKEVLEDEVTALFCDPDNIESWVQALERIRDDSGLAARLGNTAYEVFKEKYTWKARAKNVINNIT